MLKPLPDPPRYKNYLNRRKIYWQARTRTQGDALQGEMQMLLQINNKIRGTEWVRDLGLATVEYDTYPNIAQALEETTREKFVIKPEIGHSSTGVYLLTRDGKGGYDCSMTGQNFASDAALETCYDRLRAGQARGDRITERVIVEDLLEDSFGFDVPLDYKVYAFATGTPLVMQRYAPKRTPQSKWSFAFYDEAGRDLGPVRLRTAGNQGEQLKAPDCLDDIFAQARQLVKAAGVSFMRVDLYATPKGPVFGEFTPVPNNAKEEFIPEYDALLGQFWADSLKELGIDYTRPLKPRAKPA